MVLLVWKAADPCSNCITETEKSIHIRKKALVDGELWIYELTRPKQKAVCLRIPFLHTWRSSGPNWTSSQILSVIHTNPVQSKTQKIYMLTFYLERKMSQKPHCCFETMGFCPFIDKANELKHDAITDCALHHTLPLFLLAFSIPSELTKLASC